MISLSDETEDQLQMRIGQWLDLALPPGAVWHHSPNEGNRHVAYKVKQKRMGTKPGWPDIEIFVPGDQAMVRDKLELAGCFWQLCRSIDQVHEFLEGLIKLRGK